ncbi:MAG: helix-turn-helix domain-containing protein [Gorillibacterium sp.]|nr:helix-turn-helix domain-containing protein [Gorillibacterium sp.]
MDVEKYERLVPNIFLFVDRRCFPNWEIVRRKNGFHDLTFVVEGKANYYINGEKYTVRAGDMLYVPSGSVREAHTFKEAPMHSYAFNFFWEGADNSVKLPFEPVTRNRMTKEILEYTKEFAHVWMGKQPFYKMKARALFQLIVHRLLSIAHYRETPLLDPRIDKMMTYIMDHYAEDITMGDLADWVSLNPVYLGKLFKQNTGSTCKEFMNKVRVNNAEMILSAGGFTVSEVAEHCGYHDVSYFSNVFKSLKGYPPSSAQK